MIAGPTQKTQLKMSLFDSRQGRHVAFRPGAVAGMYVCGITPYDAAHLGHIFTFLTYDLIQRRLEDAGHEVRLVRNITDVDEPIYERAAQLKVDYRQLAERERRRFDTVMAALHFRPLYAEPLASEYIMPMAGAVEQLLARGYAYKVGKDIYFDVAKDKHFGELSRLPQVLARRLMAMRGGDPDNTNKRGPLDFLLWKAVDDPADPAAWDTNVGHGRPGWHIECSVMSSRLLGAPFDLHGGGADLIFPHHECEIAQSRGLGAGDPAKHWLHVAPVIYLGEKMSKSLGNMVFADDLLRSYPAAAIRLALMHYSYRVGGEWLPSYADEAVKLYERLDECFSRAELSEVETLLEELRAAIDNDLDTHALIHALEDFCHRVGRAPRGMGDAGLKAAAVARCRALLGI